MSPLTVTLFGDAPTYGGAERYLEILATGFDRQAVAPRVVLATETALDPLADRLARAGVPVARLARVPTLRSAGAFLSTFAHLAWRRTQILHFNLVDPRACNGAIVAARLSGHRRIVATNHLPQSPFDALPTPRRHRIAMAAIRHHIVVSEASGADLAATGVDRAKITVIHNSVPAPAAPTAAGRAAAREALGGGSGPIVGFVGRLVAQKNPALFIEAAAVVARVRPDARIVVVGDGPERADLERAVQSLDAASRIRFLGHREDAAALLAGLDVLVFTSLYEGLPFVALEAMSHGVPIVAVRIPGIDEAIVDQVTGRLLEGGGPAEIAASILDLLGRDDLRMRMGEAARLRMREHFSMGEMVKKTIAVYSTLVE